MKILYADDDPKYLRLVKLFLSNQGYEVLTANDGLDLISLYDKHKDANLIILDIMMPNLDGRETCKIIRENSDIPILMLTALGDLEDEVIGFDLGVDEYISKPFSNEILTRRVKSLLKRRSIEIKGYEVQAGFTLIDHSYSIQFNETVIQLTKKEFVLFKVLLMNAEKVLSREFLLDHVWGLTYVGDPRTLDTHIKSLRAKIKPYDKRIKTVRGSGYYFE